MPSSEQTPTEGEQFSYQFTLDANPVPTEFNWTRNDTAVVNGTRISVTVNSITISSVSRSDSGTYQVVSRNSVGMGSGTFTLNVLCECLSESMSLCTCVLHLLVDCVHSFVLHCIPTVYYCALCVHLVVCVLFVDGIILRT